MERSKGDKAGRAELSPLQRTALYIAQVLRNELEGFHAEHLSDGQMRELNPLMRNAVYTALYAAEQAAAGSGAAQAWVNFHSRWPDYWEPPELADDYVESARLLEDGDLASRLNQMLGRR